MKKIALFILSITLLTACSDFQDVTFSGVENFKIISLTQSGVEAEITAKIKNPNKTAFTIYKSEFDATLGGINAGKAHITKNVRIKPNSEEVYTFIIKSDFSKLFKSDKYLSASSKEFILLSLCVLVVLNLLIKMFPNSFGLSGKSFSYSGNNFHCFSFNLI